jgi:hypothetical protein
MVIISVLFCMAVLATAVIYLALRLPSRHYGWQAFWRLACIIGALRIGALWVGLAAYRRPGWSQIFGYFVQMLALPEIYFARSARGGPFRWAMSGNALLAAGSMFWVALLIWVANRSGMRDEKSGDT